MFKRSLGHTTSREYSNLLLKHILYIYFKDGKLQVSEEYSRNRNGEQSEKL